MSQRPVHAQRIRHRRRATTDHDRLGESEEGAAQSVRGAPRVGGRPHERAGLESVGESKQRNSQNGMAYKSSIFIEIQHFAYKILDFVSPRRRLRLGDINFLTKKVTLPWVSNLVPPRSLTRPRNCLPRKDFLRAPVQERPLILRGGLNYSPTVNGQKRT